MDPVSESVLFRPLKVGRITLAHRVVMAPLTRFRADENAVHHDIAVEYYTQRASLGGLQITEATFISEEAGGYKNAPGIWNSEQVIAWKKVTAGVHSKGGHIFLQLWALGRAADAKFLKSKGHRVVSASNIPQPGGAVPEPLSNDEIVRYVQTFAEAAQNAVTGAGFDGVEIHNANGYLLDQFLQTNSNDRVDEFGGNIENRARFTLMVVKAVTDAVGEDRVGIRFSPFSRYQGMRMTDPIPTFSYVIQRIRDQYPDLAYLHLIEPTVMGSANQEAEVGDSIEFVREIWNEVGHRAFLAAGCHELSAADETVQKYGGAVVLGRIFYLEPRSTVADQDSVVPQHLNEAPVESKELRRIPGASAKLPSYPTMSTRLLAAKGFSTLRLIYSQGVSHYLYVQKYAVADPGWSRALALTEDRTLFLVNVPPDATTRDLVRIFAPCGIVEKCIFASDDMSLYERPGEKSDPGEDSDSDISMDIEQNTGPKITPLPAHDIRRLHVTGQTAYCVFIDKVTLDRALLWIQKSGRTGVKWPKPPASEAALGIAHYFAKYRSLRPPLTIIKDHADTSLEAYEDRKAKAERPKNIVTSADGPIVDDDGFTLVTRKGKPSRTGHAVMTKDFQNAIQHGEENDAAIRMRKHQEKLHKKDFYTFQTREKKRKAFVGAQAQFEKDRHRVQKLQSKSRFKPY